MATKVTARLTDGLRGGVRPASRAADIAFRTAVIVGCSEERWRWRWLAAFAGLAVFSVFDGLVFLVSGIESHAFC
jgi:hypothetical protein